MEVENLSRYNHTAIGARIRQCRKEAGYSQKNLVSALQDIDAGIKVDGLRNLEYGKFGDLRLSQVLGLCEVLHCDIGYLLCEYDSKTLAADEITAYTGLSEQAINNLHALSNGDIQIKRASDRYVISFINQLLSDTAALDTLSGKLSTVAALTQIIASFEKVGKTDEHDNIYRDGAIFQITRIIADKVESTMMK